MAESELMIFDEASEISEEMFLDEDSVETTDVEPGVSLETLQSILRSAIDHAVNYTEEELAAHRRMESLFYEGEELPGDDELDETRSKVISRDVHDTVHAMLPSLLRIFFSGRDVVSYEPMGPEDDEAAKQATDYVNKIVLAKDNKGFMVFHSVFKDALIKALGVFKWWWDESFSVEGSQYSGLSQEEFMLLVNDPTVSEVAEYEEMQTEMGVLISCHITRKISQGGKIVVEAVPPEERLISKDARDIQSASFYGHRKIMTVSEVVAMGFDYNQVVEMGGSENLETNEEKVERHDSETLISTGGEDADPSMRELEYVEAYLRVDMDG
jgi:hypothetical protein